MSDEEDQLIITEKKIKGNSQLLTLKSQIQSDSNNVMKEETKTEESSIFFQEPILSVNDIKKEEVIHYL